MSDSEMPIITIVTPSYNQGDFVEWTVRSVFEQRYRKLEYIFMDGGSTDSTLERIEPYRGRFAHFESGPDGGQAAAIAKGFEPSVNAEEAVQAAALQGFAYLGEKCVGVYRGAFEINPPFKNKCNCQKRATA